MKIIIIEDEQATAERLKKLLLEIDQTIEVIEILDSIESSVKWLKTNPNPDLVFQDIQLADGSSFGIFREVNVDCPVIFTTAYDKYALEAFKVNSVDYLLKPVKKQELAASLEKYRKLHQKENKPEIDFMALSRLMKKQDYQKRFIVRYGQKIKTIETTDIAYFYTDSGNNFFRTFDNQNFPVDYSLDKLEDMLDPDIYYRINRQFIINIGAIKEMYAYSKSRVKIDLDPPCEIETIASTERSGNFKKWLGGEID
jgi:two-component system response regulator LytT